MNGPITERWAINTDRKKQINVGKIGSNKTYTDRQIHKWKSRERERESEDSKVG